MDQERLSFLALHFIPGIGSQLCKQLIGYCGSAQRVFAVPKGKLMRIPGIGPTTAESIRTGRSFYRAEKEFRRAERHDVEILFFTDKKFPSRLKAFDDAPSLLYVKGNTNLNPPKTVGIVGTREATAYGRQMVEQIVQGLVPHGPMIISGLAYGIDVHAHKQALRHDLPTVGVMGSGIDIVYPALHKEIAHKMVDHGALVTENHFGAKPDAHHFPARNRIIAGLADALIIVEAAIKGGALITAEIANSYNKDVFAFPGNIGASYSEGCNKLIKTNKAHLVTSVRDVEYIMNWDTSITFVSLTNLSGFSSHEQKVIATLQSNGESVAIDELCVQSGIPPGLLASALLNLEFNGVVSALPGKRYVLAKGTR